ncbi:hypothetical protein ABXJ56_14220 [Microbacterium chocolatum]|uniref:hypothetical protein n=1 Tax=Microbacterium aurantiacum TaxID=162393 RepID=UPI00338F730B
MIFRSLHRFPAAALSVVVLAAALAACAPAPSDPGGSSTAPPAPSATSAAPGGAEENAAPDMEAALIEREEFFEAQQQPRDGSLLSAKTPEQQEFIAQQRAYLESQGATWAPETESLLLATTLDACETAILNNHRTDASIFATHVESSPLFAQVAQGDAAAEQGLASIMVFGMSFVCPADAEQWDAAYTEVYG